MGQVGRQGGIGGKTSIQEVYSREVRPDIGRPERGRKDTTAGYISGIHKVLAEDAGRSLKGYKEDIDICQMGQAEEP